MWGPARVTASLSGRRGPARGPARGTAHPTRAGCVSDAAARSLGPRLVSGCVRMMGPAVGAEPRAREEGDSSTPARGGEQPRLHSERGIWLPSPHPALPGWSSCIKPDVSKTRVWMREERPGL